MAIRVKSRLGHEPEVVVEADFLGAFADGVEVLVVRRVGRARDADGFDLLWDLHGGIVFIC